MTERQPAVAITLAMSRQDAVDFTRLLAQLRVVRSN